jgi:hypothetical protein
MERGMGDLLMLGENCLTSRCRDEFLREEVVGDESGKKECS